MTHNIHICTQPSRIYLVIIFYSLSFYRLFFSTYFLPASYLCDDECWNHFTLVVNTSWKTSRFLFLAYVHTVVVCWFLTPCPNTRALVVSVSASCWVWRVFGGVAGRVACRRYAARHTVTSRLRLSSRTVSPWRGLWYSHDWVRAIL